MNAGGLNFLFYYFFRWRTWTIIWRGAASGFKWQCSHFRLDTRSSLHSVVHEFWGKSLTIWGLFKVLLILDGHYSHTHNAQHKHMPPSSTRHNCFASSSFHPQARVLRKTFMRLSGLLQCEIRHNSRPPDAMDIRKFYKGLSKIANRIGSR